MNLALNADAQRFIEEKVRAGQYATPEDVVHAAISRLRDDDDDDVQQNGDVELDDESLAAVEEGLAQANRGEGRPWEDVRAELRARYGLK